MSIAFIEREGETNKDAVQAPEPLTRCCARRTLARYCLVSCLPPTRTVSAVDSTLKGLE
ncbi:hypothetical protein H6F88_19380 [Oculatella sp. FACHB-28]|uniref:hypothetical protein n=1 Tax=Oculatella sp. FACHB-28 TaxID=2692845 RepID=UPI0016870D7F|nr:hypothetical protein [Oculatella sp. FACHB-28]MBD2058145.1 hypothetical protein [Oculatella sp. FACHB-28]